MMETCKTCRFFSEESAASAKARKKGGTYHDCRRCPPRLFVVLVEGGQELATFWPNVEPQYWCGEYEAKEE